MLENTFIEKKNAKRILKIYSKYFASCNGFFILPEIRLCGKWLKNLGFNNGQNITVMTENERIVIMSSKKKIVKL